MTQLLAIGECMVEMSHLSGDQLKLGFAGDSSNACIYLKRSAPDTRIQYLTVLGDDHYSDAILEMWHAENIDTSLVTRLPGELPGLSITTNSEDGERSFYYWRGQSAYKKLPDILGDRLPDADYLYVSGISFAATLPDKREQLLALVGDAVARGSRLIFDPNYRARLWTPEAAMTMIHSVLPLTSMFLTSDEDVDQLTDDPDAFLQQATEHCGEVVFRRGNRPCSIYREGTQIDVPAQTVDAIDTTGAGDSFNGTFIGQRLQGADVQSAAVAAHEVAAQVVQHKGAITPRD
ncbi:MAG: sugar kinase [Pseudomonadales bacterium]|nr:sugar kinase [Pseudomonadales bacterium]MBO6597432.1 sugar kinase [Pseudomonadales bacterium]MBO6703073.1 sugar kinase [Pseudomonadales bacterium]MBO6824166.1 sugar kinase [Pseudomonadales bacterium]MBO7006284.1 sugar kinase [Pseudomonadales bacterium]